MSQTMLRHAERLANAMLRLMRGHAGYEDVTHGVRNIHITVCISESICIDKVRPKVTIGPLENALIEHEYA